MCPADIPRLVQRRHRGRLGDLGDGQRRRLDLLGAQAVPGHVDHVIDPAEDPVVPVGLLDRAVVAEVWPVVPVLAVRVLVVLPVVGGQVPLRVAPDRLEATGPGVADADIACLAAARRDLLAVLVVDHRHVQHHPVAGLKAGVVAQQRGELVHLPEQLAVADVYRFIGLERSATRRPAPQDPADPGFWPLSCLCSFRGR
jgi:hypothetical protein